MTTDPKSNARLHVFRDHSRDWRNNAYVYPVISRRSSGLSIGINLNPDMACNFDCIYCQVDRTQQVRVRNVELDCLESELELMLGVAADGSIFAQPEFAGVPHHLQRINDIAFSGDGEPTASPVFAEAVELTVKLKRRFGLEDVKIVLITDACYLTRPKVVAGLERMDAGNGEIWAKLDAGTQEYFQLINRPNYPLDHVMRNIIAAAQQRPICIQSLFMRVHGEQPSSAEIDAYIDRLREVVSVGGRIKLVQVYTAARKPAEDYVSALSDEEVDAIADRVRQRTQLAAACYYAG